MKKTAATLLALAAAAQLAAAPLTAADQGDYVLLDQNENPTPMQMQFALQRTQWIMIGREAGGQWQPVCRGTGECRLVVSSKADVDKWKKHLPASWQPHNFGCINNTAFAFCRVDHATEAGRTGYWWFALTDGNIVPLPVNRIK